MTRTGQDAIDYARGRVGGTMPAAGYCLQFVRQCFDIGSYYASAIDAWNGSGTQHPGDRNPPPAVPLFFRTPSQYDHVVFCCSPGEIVTTFNEDIKAYYGDAISGIERDFDGQYLGWTEDLNGVTVWSGSAPPPEPEPVPIVLEDDDTMKLIRIVDDGRIMAVGTYQFAQIPTWEEYNAQALIWGHYIDMSVQDADRIHNQVNRNINDLAGSLDQFIPELPPPSSSSLAYEAHRLALLALIVALAVLVGGVTTWRSGDLEGTYAGAGVLLGGLVVWGIVRGWRYLQGRRAA